jgi:hypothetical protein
MLPYKLKTSLVGPGRPRRYLALVLLCLCLTGQFSGFAHLVSVQHGVCPEHGEVVHGPHVGGGEALAPVLTLEGLLPALRNNPAPSAEHEHEHCLFVSARRGQAVPEQALRPLRAAPLTIVRQPAGEAPARVQSIALLLLAPKNSPPG